ncbi:MAG: glycosyltransferase family 4 protein [bacterium]|nr:glycosyltransferase family 4 protein [bacterium]
MSRIALLTAHLQRNDAVGHDTLHMQEVLRKLGHEVQCFAPNADAGLDCRPPRRISEFLKSADDILIYHYAVAYPEALELFRTLNCRKIIKYHNVTPPEFFEPFHGGYADLCRRGRDMLRDFVATGPDLMLGDSKFNVEDLVAAGALPERCGIVPPFHAVDRLQELEADLDFLQRFAPDAFGAPKNLLMVGRIVPNKGYEHLIRSFALYRERYLFGGDARLILAGKTEAPLALYTAGLRKLCRDLNVEASVVFTDRISAAALKAAFLTADLFALMSEHEGFCVPAIEAMAFGVPIVALDRGAVGDTVGDGGLVWQENDPALFATSFARVLSDGDLAWELGDRGQERFRTAFSNSAIEEKFTGALREFL